MIRLVIDTNILISAALSENSTPAKVLDYSLENSRILISTDTYEEISVKLLDNKFSKYVQIETRQIFLKKFLGIAEIVPIKTSIKACRDSKDDKFLELAVNGDADFIITGDQDLLVLHPFRTVQIITASEFLRLQSVI
jgi:uncharacterized protein